jgi:hypothetical protein
MVSGGVSLRVNNASVLVFNEPFVATGSFAQAAFVAPIKNGFKIG